MSGGYKQHHYVPQWYQKKFMLPDQTEYLYLDKQPQVFADRHGNKHFANSIKKQRTRKSFLRMSYIRHSSTQSVRKISKNTFFAEIDRLGGFAMKYFEDFGYPMRGYENFLEEFLTYISTQKLRSPEGLA